MAALITSFWLYFSMVAPSLWSPSSSQQERINRVVAMAQSFIGTPYYWGGESEHGMDCSGLMVLCFQAVGIDLPRYSGDQAQEGFLVERWQIQRGDMVFFEGKNEPAVGHVGLVMHTNGEEVWFIHSSASQGVIVSRISEPYWRRRYHSTRRLWGAPHLTRLNASNSRSSDQYVPESKILDLPISTTRGNSPAWLSFQASSRKLTPEEVETMSPKDRVKAQAYVLARYGWQFEQPEIQQYFESHPWYQSLPQISDPETLLDRLTSVERYNLSLINSYI